MGESSLGVRYRPIIRNSAYLKSIGKYISGIISVSEKLAIFCENVLKIPRKSILISPNAVNTDIFKPLNVDRSFLGLSNDDFVISFIGAFIERKGIKTLINIIKDMDDVKFLLIGSGKIDLISKKIVFKGKIPHDKIPKYLNASDVFVFPTKAEGCSNAIAEAMACGLPIITSNIPEVIFQIGSDNAIFIDPNDEKKYIKEIQKLIESKEIRKNYLKNL